LKPFFEEPSAVLTVEPGNVETLTAHLQKLLLNPALCADMGRNARRTVEQLFTLERMASEMAEVYNEVCS
jgi:glycosyltransferase involved in cell wall biosynthesis